MLLYSNRKWIAGAVLSALLLLVSPVRSAERSGGVPDRMKFAFQTRESEDAEPIQTSVELDPKRMGIVLVDTWNFHWCMSATARCGSFTERFNAALKTARRLGMQVFWCPTDVADWYVGTPQRERAVAVQRHPLPEPRDIEFERPKCFQGNRCMCGPGIRCMGHYGWNQINPRADMAEADYVAAGTEELYSLCREHDLTHLIYFGFHTNVCTIGKPIGIHKMARAGIDCVLARDMTDGIAGYDPESGHHPDGETARMIRQIERQVPTISFEEEMKKVGLWNGEEVLNPVRIAPWTSMDQPYFFEEPKVVTLSAPLDPGATIRYTLDGAAPGPGSAVYEKPFTVTGTTTVRAIAYNPDGRQACLESLSRLVKLGPRPPEPDVYLGDIEPLRKTVFGYWAKYASKRVAVFDRAYGGQSLRLRQQDYERGVGVYAPSQLLYEVKPGYDRFVAMAGVDEWIKEKRNAWAIAIHPSVVFKVFIDGELVSESPTMRILHEPWRFDVKIPPGSRTISLVTTDGGNGNREDLAQWVNAGFVRVERETAGK